MGVKFTSDIENSKRQIICRLKNIVHPNLRQKLIIGCYCSDQFAHASLSVRVMPIRSSLLLFNSS